MRYTRRFLSLGLAALTALSVTACKPTYEAPVSDPVMTTAAADVPYEMDFTQLNNDVIDSYSKTHVVFPFIKSMEVSGDNDAKTINLDIDIQDGISSDAVLVLLADATKKIANNAYIQDFRLTTADDTQFGSVYNIYSYSFKVTCDGETVIEDTVAAGDEIPLDPSRDGNTIMEEQEAKADDSTEETSTAAAESSAQG